MKAALFAYSRRGMETGRKVCRALTDEISCYAPERLAGEGYAPIPKPSRDFYGEKFRESELLVFVGSCGIAVREIAPFVASKTSDPAVVCLDEGGNFVISLLSGHIGGANALTRRLAEALGATPVITTATDVNRKFSVDTWATENGYALSDLKAAKAVSAAILEGPVPLKSDFPIRGKLPPGVIAGETGKVGIYLTWGTEEPFDVTLRLIPKALHLGIGCRKGISAQAVENAVSAVLEDHKIDRRAIARAASIDLKAQEAGLLQVCEENHWPVTFYTADQLLAVEGTTASSAFVRSVTGVDNVCERAALAAAERLLIEKTALGGVTVALAAEHWEVDFG